MYWLSPEQLINNLINKFRVQSEDSIYLGKCPGMPAMSMATDMNVCDCSTTTADCGYYGEVRTCGIAKDFSRGKYYISLVDSQWV